MLKQTGAADDRDILLAALDLPEEQREAFLDEACSGNLELRERLSKMLKTALLEGSFMASPVFEIPQTIENREIRVNGCDGGMQQNAVIEMSTTLPSSGSISVGDSIRQYKLLEQIGEGGMGVVYMALQRQPLRRTVALKLIKPGMDSRQVVARFAAERQSLALMNHPHIAKVLDAGTTEAGLPFFVMELVKGIPITDFCDQHRLDLRQRLELFVKVCEAIQHAHQKGVIHRDLKPSNILVELEDVKAVPKVIDFGVAKATHQSLSDNTLYTGFSQLIGTPLYMSPEQASLNSLDVDTRSDIYSLGVVLYELLTGSTPFDNATLKQAGFDGMRQIICEQEPQRPSQHVSTLKAENRSTVSSCRNIDPRQLSLSMKRELDWIVMKTLEKDRIRRYESASALALDIQRFLDDEPVHACPASVQYRLSKVVRRYKGLLTAACLIIIALLTGTVVAVWQAVVATNANSIAAASLVTASSATKSEERARKQAEQLTQETRQLLSKRYVSAGIERMEQNNLAQSLPWFVEALKVDSSDPQSQAIHRTRIAMVMQQCPKLVGTFDTGIGTASLSYLVSSFQIAQFDRQDRPIALRMRDQAAQLYDVTTGEPIGRPIPTPNASEGYFKLSPQGGYVQVEYRHGWALWDVAGNRIISKDTIQSPCHYSFSPDDKWLCEMSMPGIATIWETKSGSLLDTKEIDLTGWDGAFPPVVDNDQVLLFDWRRVRVWVPGSEIRTRTLAEHTRGLSNAQLSHNGQRFVTACRDTTAGIYDVKTLMPVGPPLAHRSFIQNAYFSPDDSTIVTVGDHTARLWDVKTGYMSTPPMRHDGVLKDAAFSRDGRFVITASVDTTARIWDTSTGQLAYPILNHHTQVARAQFDSTGRMVLTITSDGIVHYWDLAASSPPGIILDDVANGTSAVFSENGSRLLASAPRARLWDPETGTPLSVTMANSAESVASTVFDLKRERIVTFGTSPNVRMWDATANQTLKPLWEVNTQGSPFRFISPFVGPQGRHLLTVDQAGVVKVWDADSGATVAWPVTETRDAVAASFSPNGRYIATGSSAATHAARTEMGAFRLWRGDDGRPLCDPIPHKGPVSIFAFSPDERRVATASGFGGGGSGEIRIFDTETGTECCPAIRENYEFQSLDFHPNSTSLVTSASDQTARVWDVVSGRPMLPPMTHQEHLVSAIFSPDGRFVITTTGMEQLLSNELAGVRLWDAISGALVAPPLRHSDPVRNLTHANVRHDARRVVSVSRDGTNRIWQIATEENPTEDIEGLAKLLSSRRLDDFGNLSAIDGLERLSLWKELRLRHPAWFITSDQQLIAWRHREAIHCQETARYSQAISLCTELINAMPEGNFGLHQRRALCAISLGKFDLAADDLNSLIDAGGAGYLTHYQAALLAVRRQDQTRYKTLCSEMWNKFSQSDDQGAAGYAVWTMCLGPNATESYEPAVARALLARDAGGPQSMLILGAIFLRAGRFDEALEQLTANREEELTQQAENAFLLALTLFKLDKPQDAHKSFTLAKQLTEQALGSEANQPPWNLKLTLELFQAEVEKLIDPTVGTAK